MTRCNELAFLSCEGTVVNGECHSDSRLVDLNERERLGIKSIAESITDVDVSDTCNAYDLTDGSF